MPILLTENKEQFTNFLNQFNNRVLLRINHIIKRIVVMTKHPFNPTVSDLFLLASEPEKFALKVMTGQTEVDLSGIPIPTENALKLLDYPPELESILTYAKHSELQDIQAYQASDFEIVNDRLKFTDTKLEQIRNSYFIYTQNSRQEAEYELVNQIADLVKQTHMYKTAVSDDLRDSIALFRWIFETGGHNTAHGYSTEFKPNVDYITEIE